MAQGTSGSLEAAWLEDATALLHELPERFHLGDPLHGHPHHLGVGRDSQDLLRPAERLFVNEKGLPLQRRRSRHGTLRDTEFRHMHIIFAIGILVNRSRALAHSHFSPGVMGGSADAPKPSPAGLTHAPPSRRPPGRSPPGLS